MLKNLFVFFTVLLSAGCSTTRLAEDVDKDAIAADDAVIQSYDDEVNYSTAMQLVYLGTQKDPDVHNNLDKLSKDYYHDIDVNNSVMSLASAYVWTQSLFKMDAVAFFFGTRKYDQLFGHYKSNSLLFIEPFSNDESAELAYTRTQDKFTSLIKAAYSEDNYRIFEFEDSVFGDITKFTSVWDTSTKECQGYVESPAFTPVYLDAPEEFRSCHISRYGFIWNPIVINGALDIPGVPQADRYFVVSYAYSDNKLEMKAKQSTLQGVYAYEPAYTWYMRGETEAKYQKDPALMKQDIERGLISPFPYLLRLEDQAVLMFKPE